MKIPILPQLLLVLRPRSRVRPLPHGRGSVPALNRGRKGAYLAIRALGTILPCLLLGQTDVGRFVGTVTDGSGAVIPGATVNLKSGKTGLSRKVTTNESGDYIIAQLPPASYDLTAEGSGMSP